MIAVGKELLTALERRSVEACPEVIVTMPSGIARSSEIVKVPFDMLGVMVRCIVLDESPAVLSSRKRCVSDGFNFTLSEDLARITTPDGMHFEFEFDDTDELFLRVPIKRRRWIIDFCSHDIIGKAELTALEFKSISKVPEVKVQTSYGVLVATEIVDIRLEALGIIVSCLVVDQSPPLLSVGKRCACDGFAFCFNPGGRPSFKTPDGRSHECELDRQWFSLVA